MAGTIHTFQLTDILTGKVLKDEVEIDALLGHFQHKETFFESFLRFLKVLKGLGDLDFRETMNVIRQK